MPFYGYSGNNKHLSWIPRLFLIIETISLVILVSATAFGFIGLKVNTPIAATVTVYRACGEDMVRDYNSILLLSGSDYTSGLIKLGQRVGSITSSGDDATCQYIVMQAAVEEKNLTKIKQAAERLKQLAKQGVYPNNNIQGLIKTHDLDAFVSTSAAADQNNWVTEGQG